ncbi:MAG: beta-propeller fold lactonase family protein, partial [Planctomycetota bacterium]|nr:beta-propeller fold lactonase family protein [Planctomycetota bacterium]
DGDALNGFFFLAGASSIAVAPDGRFVYVTAAIDNSISVFSGPNHSDREPGLVLPTIVQSLTDGMNSVAGISGASSIAISPDGRNVYVTGELSDSVAMFDRDPELGTLTFVESLIVVTSLSGPTSVVVNPDGQQVYVAASGIDAIVVFDRNSEDGSLTFVESPGPDPDGEGKSVSGLNLVSSVTASTDGLNVYATGAEDNSVVRFNTPRHLNVSFGGLASLSITTSDADDLIEVGIEGLPTTASIDSGGSVDDVVTIMGTLNNDTINVNGGTLTFGGTTLTLTDSEFLNVLTDSGDDTVNVTASTTGPHLSVNGGAPPAAGDTLNIDVLAAEPSNSGTAVTFTGGFQTVSYSGFEAVAITVRTIPLDFGDAPDSFGTTLENDGPRHVVGTLFLGDAIDSETDAFADPQAFGDDSNSAEVDDEDGITFLSALSVGTTRQIRVSASAAGVLDAWIDFNGNRMFDASENLSAGAVLTVGGSASNSGGFTAGTGISVPPGFSTVSFNIPNNAMSGATFARFRLSSTGGLSPTGQASDGEVEDYRVEIVAAPGGNSTSIEPALNIAVEEFFNAFPDELNDPDPDATGNELPLAVQAENGAQAERVDGDVDFDQTDPALRVVIQAINDIIQRLEQNRGLNENIFVLALHPVDFLLTDPQGRTVGFTQATGTVNQIGANATFSGDGVVELLTIRNADAGQYGLQLVGVGGVFRGGASLITPSGTQQVTFQGSLAQVAGVQLALSYQEGTLNIPARTDLAGIDFSEIANAVAQLPSAAANSRTLAAGVTEALASIQLDQLDATINSPAEDSIRSLQELLERLGLARKRLLDAIETSLDDDDLDKLKLVFGDTPEDADGVSVLTRVLLEALSGPLVSVPQQIKDVSSSLEQLLKELREQRNNPPPPANIRPLNDVPNSDDGNGATKPEADDKRTSQRSRDRNSPTIASSAFVVESGQDSARQHAAQATATRVPARNAVGTSNVGKVAVENSPARG